ncbi:BnaC03g70230D [Brassica napus]|uniref:(rape) hypothetical protein n=1 Tax=Brassica napus TaxID=3708 RepID=A0A078FB23_BRANA|nr:unnamed protein product [Brassica napus]CDY10591.1 BnaC03g70230D [Brassica napus]
MTNYGTIPTSSHPSPPIDLERSDNLFLDEEAVAASEYSGLTSYPSS